MLRVKGMETDLNETNAKRKRTETLADREIFLIED
jgi:hypothetical protein